MAFNRFYAAFRPQIAPRIHRDQIVHEHVGVLLRLAVPILGLFQVVCSGLPVVLRLKGRTCPGA